MINKCPYCGFKVGFFAKQNPPLLCKNCLKTINLRLMDKLISSIIFFIGAVITLFSENIVFCILGLVLSTIYTHFFGILIKT